MRRGALLLAAALAACERIDSENIATAGIYADLEADGYGGGVTFVSAELRAGGELSNVTVDLGSCDRLVATLAGEERPMAERDDLFGRVWYETSFLGEVEGAELRVAFLRSTAGGCTSPGPSAPDSTVTLPAPFTVTAPAAGAVLSRSAGFTVSWTPARSDFMHLWVTGPCLDPAIFAASPGASSLRVPAGALRPLHDPLASCGIELALVRSRAGVVDPAFGEGGSFLARQSRRIAAQSVP